MPEPPEPVVSGFFGAASPVLFASLPLVPTAGTSLSVFVVAPGWLAPEDGAWADAAVTPKQ